MNRLKDSFIKLNIKDKKILSKSLTKKIAFYFIPISITTIFVLKWILHLEIAPNTKFLIQDLNESEGKKVEKNLSIKETSDKKSRTNKILKKKHSNKITKGDLPDIRSYGNLNIYWNEWSINENFSNHGKYTPQVFVYQTKYYKGSKNNPKIITIDCNSGLIRKSKTSLLNHRNTYFNDPYLYFEKTLVNDLCYSNKVKDSKKNIVNNSGEWIKYGYFWINKNWVNLKDYSWEMKNQIAYETQIQSEEWSIDRYVTIACKNKTIAKSLEPPKFYEILRSPKDDFESNMIRSECIKLGH